MPQQRFHRGRHPGTHFSAKGHLVVPEREWPSLEWMILEPFSKRYYNYRDSFTNFTVLLYNYLPLDGRAACVAVENVPGSLPDWQIAEVVRLPDFGVRWDGPAVIANPIRRLCAHNAAFLAPYEAEKHGCWFQYVRLASCRPNHFPASIPIDHACTSINPQHHSVGGQLLRQLRLLAQ